MSIVKPEDFTLGYYYIPKNENQKQSLQSYIDNVECEYLPDLLGVELYELFIADLDTNNVPQTQIYKDIFDPFKKQEPTQCIGSTSPIINSKGMKEMIMGIVYFVAMRDRTSRIATTGIKRTDGMNSENVNGVEHDLNGRYNKGVETYKAIQYFIVRINDCVDYPTFLGVDTRYNQTF
jgi:hypothetical protein